MPVTPTARYLKAHYGTRIAQGKALVAMLAGIEHPAATQLMLSIANRFRTKALQDEAMRYAAALAEKRGWSLTELADRTMPTAGFDEEGAIELSYGERAFTARLGPGFTVELYSPEGKQIKTLPAPRQDDDATIAKESKKVFTAAKDEIKAIVQAQTDRLYEAMCTQRDWRYEDWNLYFNRHPVVRRLAQGLVWAEMREGKVARTFRPARRRHAHRRRRQRGDGRGGCARRVGARHDARRGDRGGVAQTPRRLRGRGPRSSSSARARTRRRAGPVRRP
jgi:hypothetical protein